MEEKKEEELQIHTVIFMISVAAFYDTAQFLLNFIWLGWVVGIFANLTFYVWFKMHGISFMKPKRFFTFAGATLIESFPWPPPISFISSLPTWTAAVSYLALSKKIQSVIPGADIVKLDIMKQ